MPIYTPAIEIIGSLPARKPAREIVISPTPDDLTNACSHDIDSYSDTALEFVQRVVDTNCFVIDLPLASTTPCLDSYKVDKGVVSLVFYGTDYEDRSNGEVDEEITHFSFPLNLWSNVTEVTQDNPSIFDFEGMFDFEIEINRCIKVIIYSVISHFLSTTQTAGSA